MDNKTNDKTIIQKTIIAQIKRQALDIQNGRDAIKTAELEKNPKRIKLYDIYDDILLDTHVSSVIDKRKTSILNSRISFHKNGVPDDAINAQLKSPWFTAFLNDLLDTRFWGYSVFQFYRDGEWINYDLLPRKHILPLEKKLLVKQTDSDGEDYTSYPNILECGNPTDLGLLSKIMFFAIYKRNALGDFSQYAELFGQPIREGTYDGNDDTAREKLLSDLTDIGSSAVVVHPSGTTVNILDSLGKGTTTTLYKDLIALCNAEISKCVLGNTLTTDQGTNGSRALGEVHQDSETDKKEADRIYILNTLQYNLSDIFKNLGYNTEGGEFFFEKDENVDLAARILIDKALNALGLPIDHDYFYNTYGIPKPTNYEELKKSIEAKQKSNPQSFQNHLDDEFRFSPDKKKHINVKPSNLWKKGLDFFD